MRIGNCFVCSRPIYPSKGITFVGLDGKSKAFCRSKCHAQFKMKRNPRKLRWTKAFRKSHGKEMVVDTSLQFAARRNVPVRYNREHISTTIKAMERISEIRARRERVFYKKRMEGNKIRQREADRKLVEENQHLLPRERATERLAREAVDELKEAEELGMAMETEISEPIETKTEQKVKRKLLVNGGIESMEID